MASKFIHLHTHSHYTFLQALPKIDDLVEKAVKDGMDAVALTDGGNMHGAIEFYKAAKAANIKPILGVDAYLAPRTRHDKDKNLDAKRSRIVLLAENNEGYKNLLFLVTKSWSEGFFERPRIDKDLLKSHGKGLIAILPSFAADTSQLLKAGDANGAAAALAEFKSILGAGNVYLEISHHPKAAGHTELMEKVITLGKNSDTPLVAQNDVYYLDLKDREACEVMRRIQLGGGGRANEDEDFSFITQKRALELFKAQPESLENSVKIAERCNVDLTLGQWTFPSVPISPGFKNHDEELRATAYAGIKLRGLEETEVVKDRIEYELGIIISKGFAVYYLIVADLLRFAKSAGILTTTRGSAAGSLVAYLVGITNVDPLFYKLPFERFLNPERPKAPDIDMDMADNRRDEMIAYTKRKYGEDHVAQIGTFGTMMARAAVRDVARALGHSYGVGDRIAKLIPIGSQGFPMTIDKALELEPDLKALYQEDDDAKQVIDLAKQIEGCVRHVGVHAAGVVVSPTPLIEWSPVQPDPKGTGKMITQYDMYSITDEYGGVGLLKFDFLGIKNLAILADAVKRVKETRGIVVDIENVNIDDAKTFEMLARGETEGVFQLNGSGMTRYLKELRPTTIHDINAMVALYRPGPMDVIPEYIERKRNAKLIKYLDPRMEEYLKESYGLLVYQDDLLLSAVHLAGYSWGEVDKFRKAIGKKIPAEMAAQEIKFIAGVLKHGQTTAFANKLWKLFEPFQAYGFNKAHAASYGKVAYQTAYMKANYPVEYVAALLTADSGDTDSIAILVAEAKRMKITVLPPDVNESGADFTVVEAKSETSAGEGMLIAGARQPDAARTEPFPSTEMAYPERSIPNPGSQAIRFGLSSIKNFGDGVAHAILEEREKNGQYKSLEDFLSRVTSKNLNKKSLESLIKCGALSSLAHRSNLLANVETMLAYHRDATTVAPQDSLFGSLSSGQAKLHLVPGAEVSMADKLAWEKELLGIFVSGHPLDAHAAMLNKAGVSITKIKMYPVPGQLIILPVLIGPVRSVITKGGDKMAFITFEDANDSIEGVVFPKLFKEHAHSLVSGACFLIKGKVANRNGEISLAIEDLKLLA